MNAANFLHQGGSITGLTDQSPAAEVLPHAEVQAIRGGVCLAIEGIETVMRRCVEQRALPSELGDVPWAVKATTFDLRSYREFKGPKQG